VTEKFSGIREMKKLETDVTTRHRLGLQKEVPWMAGMTALEASLSFFRISYSPSFNTSQPKVHVVSEGYYVAFTVNIRLNIGSTRLEMTTEN
jgi:hypothetical protein